MQVERKRKWDVEPFSSTGIYGLITEIEPYGGPQLSQQKQITHGKSKSLTAKANRSRQKQINSMRYFYPAEYTNLVWSSREQKNPVSTTFTRNLEMKSPRSCVRVRFYE